MAVAWRWLGNEQSVVGLFALRTLSYHPVHTFMASNQYNHPSVRSVRVAPRWHKPVEWQA